MNSGFVFEAVGMTASFLVCVSLCMTHIKTLRIINLVGSVVFVVYGVLIRSPSVIVLDAFSACVNVFYLVRMRNDTARTDLFDMILTKDTDEHVRRFIRFHGEDIRRFFPSFDPDPETGSLRGAECCFILRETLPVSLVALRRENNGQITVILDYAAAAYRDFKNAAFFFNNVVNRIAPPGTVFFAKGETPAHVKYLRKMGFAESGTGAALFSRSV